MALIDDLVAFVSDNTSDGSWQKPQLYQRTAKFIDDHDLGGGGGNGILCVDIVQDGEDYVLSKTYAEIKNAIQNGQYPVFKRTMTIPDVGTEIALPLIISIAEAGGTYAVNVDDGGEVAFMTDDENGYPSVDAPK